jgi:hypothetical protein
VSCLLALLAPVAGAQTIADYSRAQRTLLENAMTQAAARSAGLGASTAAASAVPSPMPLTHSLLPVMATVTPALLVSGVFASSNGAIAEVMVNATPYLLGAGQGVPGTAWSVESIAVDRVVLSRHGGVVAAADAQAARKVFPLPALR